MSREGRRRDHQRAHRLMQHGERQGQASAPKEG